MSVREIAQRNEELAKTINAAKYPAIPLRPHQAELFYAFVNSPLFVEPLAKAGRRPSNKLDRFFPIWCRRAGKDVISFQCACAYAAAVPHSIIVYLFPERRQAEEAVFAGTLQRVGKERKSMSFLDMVPEFARKAQGGVNAQKLAIKFKNGSIIYFGSSLRYNLYRGLNASLVIYSEFAYSHPEAESTFAPMLTENGGAAIYPTTPNGRNFAYERILDARMQDPNTPKEYRYKGKDFIGNCMVRIYPWYNLFDEEGYAIHSEEGIAKEAALKGMTPEKKAQEYDCAFNKAGVGTIYGREMSMLRSRGQIVEDLPLAVGSRFYTAWDIGNADDTAIWIINETADGYFNAVDFIHGNCETVEYYCKQITDWETETGIVIDTHFGPHDVGHVRMGITIEEFHREQSKKNAAIRDLAAAAGVEFHVVKKPNSKEDVIALTRRLLPSMRFAEKRSKCSFGVKALEQWYRPFNPETGETSRNPVRGHWTAHPSDALGTFALGLAEKYGFATNLSTGSRVGKKLKNPWGESMSSAQENYAWM